MRFQAWFFCTITLLLMQVAWAQTPGSGTSETKKHIEIFWKVTLDKVCQGKIVYPPDCALIRAFKREREVEVWGKKNGERELSLLCVLPICAVDGHPGPKLQQGDEKTPEGFYYGSLDFYSKYWWMWMELRHERLENPGIVGLGHCFKICMNYPNAIDMHRTKDTVLANPGDGICIHGNCTSKGCLSLTNADYLTLFGLVMHHDEGLYGPMQIHIFPYRYDRVSKQQRDSLAFLYQEQTGHNSKRLIAFWESMKTGYELFDREKNPLVFDDRGLLGKGYSAKIIGDIKLFFKNKYSYPGPIDDVYSDDLEPFIKEFQAKYRLPVSGEIGPMTANMLSIFGLEVWVDYGFKPSIINAN